MDFENRLNGGLNRAANPGELSETASRCANRGQDDVRFQRRI
jgi:hypothetical protein